MRIHRLEVQALGPFPGHETIDFDALGSGILLVNGPTGSGKSSLLDAIAFALFGDVPGARKSLRSSLRSHHAPTDREPFVELIFSVGSQRWKIWRSPEWDAPKKRVKEGASATTRRQAGVVLSRWHDNTWQAESTRLDEAGQVIGDILGMGLAQFAQVIVLPQGEFAAFLRAKPEDRRVLLERLFDVERFERIESWFLERKGASAQALSESSARLRNYVALVRESALSLDAALLAPTVETENFSVLENELDDLVRAISAGYNTRQNQSRSMARAAEHARGGLVSATQILRSHAAWQEAQNNAEKWTQERLDHLNTTLERAQAARVLSETHTRRERAAQLLHDARRSVETATRDLDAALVRSPLDAQALMTLVDVDAVAEKQLFDRAVREKKDLDDKLHVKATAEATLAQAQSELTVLTQDFETAKLRVETATREEISAQQRLDETPDASQTVDRIEKLLTDLAQRSAPLSQERVAAKVAFEEATRKFSEAEAQILRLRARRLEGIAGELAHDLKDGVPCAVCGSREHPAPADLLPDAPNDDVIETAEKAAIARNDERLAAATQKAASEEARKGFVADIHAQLSHIDDEAVHALDAEALVTESSQESASERILHAVLSGARQRHLEKVATRLALAEAYRAAAEATKTMQREMQRAEVKLAQASAQQNSADLAAQRAHESLALAKSAWEETQGALADAVILPWTGANGSLEDVAAAYDTIEGALSRAARAQEVATLRDEGCQDADRELAEALGTSPFTSMNDVEAATLDELTMTGIQDQWRAGVQIRARVDQTLNDTEICASAFTPAPSLEALQDALNRAEQKAEVAKEQEAQWGSAHGTILRIQERIHEELTTFEKANADAVKLSALADAFAGGGDNERRMRLTSYVLAAHLEMVTTFANHRLTRMSGGRYQLQYTDELASRGRKSGLGLQVVDAWTGRARDTATLSGGEAFMASLALALGLGDAVLADSGGLKLDTLFVDEGFGSLDQDTLEEVMAVLDELREGGRLVGIISHVSELRARIPTHIDVVKGPEGSHIRIPTDLGSSEV